MNTKSPALEAATTEDVIASSGLPTLFSDEPAPGSLIALNGGALLQLLEAERSLRAMLLYRQMQLKIDEALRVEN